MKDDITTTIIQSYYSHLEKLLDHVGVHTARADCHHPHPVLGPGRASSVAQTSDNIVYTCSMSINKRFKDLCQQDNLRQHMWTRELT